MVDPNNPPPPDPPPPDPESVPPPPSKPLSAAEVQAMLDAVKQEIRDQVTQSVAQAMPAQPVAPLTGFAAFTQSGIFFILLGLALLLVAYWGLGIVHTTFSFVLVVLGVAILLYGTGTQGMGRVERASDQAKYNIALAGGAGVLSFCIAYGIVHYSGEMQRAFQIERKYVLAVIKPNPDGNSSFASYWAQFQIDGVPIPAMRRGDFVVVYIPYLETQKDGTQRISFLFQQQDSATRDPLLRPSFSDQLEINLSESRFDRGNGGYDFPVYKEPLLVDLRSTATSGTVLRNAGSRQLTQAAGATAPNATAPAVVEAQ
jgi:membrane protein implicated in regulation of membrane protease activity